MGREVAGGPRCSRGRAEGLGQDHLHRDKGAPETPVQNKTKRNNAVPREYSHYRAYRPRTKWKARTSQLLGERVSPSQPRRTRTVPCGSG